RRSHRFVVPCNLEILPQQAECRGAVWYPPQEAILPWGQARSEDGSGNAEHHELPRWAVRGLQGFGQRDERGITVAEHELASELGDEMRPPRVQQQADVLGRVATCARAPVAGPLHPARQGQYSGQPPQRQVDLDRIVAQAIGLVSDAQGLEELLKPG